MLYTVINNEDSSFDLSYLKIMEEYYDVLCEAYSQNKSASELNEEEKSMLLCLTEYYEGGQWLRDYEADEKGLIPTEVKRGVLSQDGLYNLLLNLEI